jgi:catechol 2,3-dioxygenase-like lactoylglutathione lyase family enzyme
MILYCRKWDETVAFYEKKLGLPINFFNEWFVEFNLNNNARLSVANEERSSIKSGEGEGITISLEVQHIETMHSLMAEKGLNPTSVKEIWKSRLFYIKDPEGNRIEFWS